MASPLPSGHPLAGPAQGRARPRLALADLGQLVSSPWYQPDGDDATPACSERVARGGGTAEATGLHVQLFFRGGAFVGYEIGSAAAAAAGAPDVATAKGLRLGDTLGQARRLYGQAFSVSSAQGGPWTARTAQGRLVGLLLQPPGARGAADRIQLIAAGYLGCPAMTP